MRILRNARCCISQAVFLYATVTRLWEGGMPCVRLKSEDSLLNEEEWLREYDQTGNLKKRTGFCQKESISAGSGNQIPICKIKR